MRKIAISAIFIFVGLFACNLSAQTNAISKHFKQFQRDTSFTKVSVTSRMFSLFTEIEADDEDEEEILAAMAKLKGIKALVKNDSDNARNLYFDALDVIQEDGGYEELMTVEDGTENIYFTIREEADKISELLMVIGGNQNFMMMTLFGEIDLNSIAKLSRVLKIKGMEAFEVLDPDNEEKKK